MTDSQKLDEAIKNVQAFNHYVRIGNKHHIESDYCDEVDLLIQSAQECQGLRRNVEEMQPALGKLKTENEQLRAEIASLRKQLPEVVTVEGFNSILDSRKSLTGNLCATYLTIAECLQKRFLNGLVIKGE